MGHLRLMVSCKKIGRKEGSKCEKKACGKIDLYYLVKGAVGKCKSEANVARLCKAAALSRIEYHYYRSTEGKWQARRKRDEECAKLIKEAFDSYK